MSGSFAVGDHLRYCTGVSKEEKNFFFCKNLKRTEDSKDTGKGPVLGMGKRGYTKGVLFFQ